MNWAHQYTAPLDQAALDANDRTMVLPGLPQFFPEANPLDLLPQATLQRRHSVAAASIGVVQRRAPLAVLRLQHAVELLGQPDEDRRARTT